jgi:hypothetical protein
MTDPAYQVVVSFGYSTTLTQPGTQVLFQDAVLRMLGSLAMDSHGHSSGPISVAVRGVGAQDESSTDEGRWDAPPSHQDGPGRPQGGS